MGHKTLQNERLLRMAKAITAANTAKRTKVAALTLPRPLDIRLGKDTWSAAAGQMRQKMPQVCSPQKNGKTKTMPTKTKYFTEFIQAGRSILGVGIL